MPTFKENFREFCRLSLAADSLRRTFDRHYSYESLGWLPLGAKGVSADLTVHVYMTSWDPKKPDERPRYSVKLQNSFEQDVMTARQARQVAAIKQLFEDWIDGKIDSVPTELPASIRELA